MSEKVDLGFDYEAFFKDRKGNPSLRLPRQIAYDTTQTEYQAVYQQIGDAEFEIDAPHEMFALDKSDSKWEMVNALRGKWADDSTRRLKITTQERRFLIENQEDGSKIAGLYDTTSPLKFVLEVGGVTPRDPWLVDRARQYINGRGLHMDSKPRINLEQENISYWNSFLERAVSAHFGSLASDRQSAIAA
jgi:hypothetical protein